MGIRILSTCIVCVLGANLALAQGSPSAPTTDSRVSLSAGGGLSAGMHDGGAALGGAVTFQLNDRLAIEGTGGYLDRGPGAEAITAAANVLVNLVASDAKAVPYLAIGGGLYRASFDLGNRRFFGTMDPRFGPGTQLIPIQGMHGFGMMQGAYTGPSTWTGPWDGPTFVPSRMPAFYLNRLGSMMVPADGNWGSRAFTDPAVTLGGGVRLDVTPRLFVRPDARALVIMGDGDTYTLNVISFSVGYRF